MQKSLVPRDDEFVDFSRHERTLEERLESIKIEPGAAEEEARKAGARLLRDKLYGLFKVPDIINTFLKWGEETDKAVKGIKREKLFEAYLNLSDSNEEAISQLKAFLSKMH
jgi:hypothetical protein